MHDYRQNLTPASCIPSKRAALKVTMLTSPRTKSKSSSSSITKRHQAKLKIPSRPVPDAPYPPKRTPFQTRHSKQYEPERGRRKRVESFFSFLGPSSHELKHVEREERESMYNHTNSLETKNTITTPSLPSPFLSLYSLRDADSPVFIKGIKLHEFFPPCSFIAAWNRNCLVLVLGTKMKQR